jgi:hypothetical protein
LRREQVKRYARRSYARTNIVQESHKAKHRVTIAFHRKDSQSMTDWSLSRFAKSSRRLRAILACLIGVVLVLITAAVVEPVKVIPDPTIRAVLEVLREFIREIGFALVVAVIIWSVFEYFAREENEALWKQRVEEITTNVFYAMHRRNFPTNYITVANDIILKPSFIRSGWFLHYSLRDSTFKHNGTSIDFVEVTCVSHFEVTNIDENMAQFPLRVSLPNPADPSLKPKVGVSNVLVWREGRREDVALSDADVSFRKQMDDNVVNPVFHAGFIDVHPKQKIEVSVTFTLAKQFDDTELIQTLYPTDSLRITISDHGPTKRFIRARSIHPDALEIETPVHATGTYQARINRYLLPHHGFIFWWGSIR